MKELCGSHLIFYGMNSAVKKVSTEKSVIIIQNQRHPRSILQHKPINVKNSIQNKKLNVYCLYPDRQELYQFKVKLYICALKNFNQYYL